MNFDDVLAELQEGDTAAVYLLHGEESERRREFLQVLRQQLGIGDLENSSLNYQKFVGDEANAETVLGACRTLTFDGNTRLVVAVDPPVIAGKDEEETKRWVSYVENPNFSNCLCIITSKLDKRRSLYRRISSSVDAREVSCDRPDGTQLRDWIKRITRARGKNITSEALQMLAEYDAPLSLIRQELEKICTFAGKRSTITADDVSTLSCLPPEQNIFALVDAVGRRQAETAVVQVKRMLQDGAEPLMLLAMIARQVRLIWHTQYYRSRGYNNRKIAGELELPGFVVRKYAKQGRNFTSRELQQSLEIIWQCDLGIKKGQWPAELAVERLVVMLSDPEVQTERTSLGPDR